MAYIDLRDIIENKRKDPEAYREWKKAIEDQTGYDFAELAENEPTMISEDDFEDYARELAEDIGAISRDTQWPATCIDWEYAAHELKMDYSEVEVDGVTYYFRAY